jgi:hypothetical protein
VLIHYVGYDQKYDEWLARSSPRLSGSELKPAKQEASSSVPAPSATQTSTASPVFSSSSSPDALKQELSGGAYDMVQQVHASCITWFVHWLYVAPACSFRLYLQAVFAYRGDGVVEQLPFEDEDEELIQFTESTPPRDSTALAPKFLDELSPVAANNAQKEFLAMYLMVQPVVQHRMVQPVQATKRLVADGRKWGHDVEIKCSLVWLTDGKPLGQVTPDVNLYVDCIEPDTGNTTRRRSVQSGANNNLSGMSNTMREFMTGLVAAEHVRMEYIHWDSAPTGNYALWVSSATAQNSLSSPFEVHITIKDEKTFAVKSKQHFESIGGGEEKLAFEVDVSCSGKWKLHKVSNCSQVGTAHILCTVCIRAARILLGLPCDTLYSRSCYRRSSFWHARPSALLARICRSCLRY